MKPETERGRDIMAQISFRVDDDIKRGAEKVFDSIGVGMATAINIYLRAVVRENRIPFELSAEPIYRRGNMEEKES